MMEALFASSSAVNASVVEAASNCTPAMRKVFTPIGSYGVHAFTVYAVPIICALGIIGNIITFIIINESANRIIGHFYIKMLTIFDSLTLICLLPPIWIVLMVRPFYHIQNPYGNTWADIVSTRWGWCQARLIITFFTRTISIYIIVLFTVERCLKIMKPFLAQGWCTVQNARRSMIILVVSSLLLSIQYGFGFEKITLRSPCFGTITICKTVDVFYYSRTFYMILLSVIPSLVIIVCNCLIIYGMKKSAGGRYRQNLTDGDEEDSRERRAIESDETKQQREITNRLLLVSFTFFILNFPLFVITTIHSNSELTDQTYHLSGIWADAFQITLVLFILNLAINFILYCFTGTLFRKAALNLVLCRIDRMRRFRAGLSGAPQSATTIVSRESARVSRGDSSLSGRQLLQKNKKEKAAETGV